LPDIIVDRKD